ncbi:hypothetical protein EC957_011491 [Mortierella hygrophila]|uniref:Uncharacterized protein n=1 Tax=Mortierella hygrophila TaxID=979708 RepID=A0A9P6F8V2_9FUNG|nr:hypothetical protein EC957_011491 [Mortierella hygrophila]
MNLDPLFSIGSALEHRFNQLTLTVMTEECQEWDPWFLTGTHRVPLGRLAFSGMISSNNNTLDDILELEGCGFVIDGVTSTKLRHLDLADMRLSLGVICRRNRRFPNLERLAVVDLTLLDLSRRSTLDLVDGFSKIAGRNRFEQFTFTKLKHNIKKQKEIIALLRAECLQGPECLTLKCHLVWAFLDFAPGNVSPHPFTSLSTLERLEILRPNFSKPMSEKSAIKFNAMLKSNHRLKHLVIRTPLLRFEVFEGLGVVSLSARRVDRTLAGNYRDLLVLLRR